jgi:hypothetical protein
VVLHIVHMNYMLIGMLVDYYGQMSTVFMMHTEWIRSFVPMGMLLGLLLMPLIEHFSFI